MGIIVETNGFCALIDCHIHTSSGAIILVANSPSSLVTANSRILLEQNLALNLGTFYMGNVGRCIGLGIYYES